MQFLADLLKNLPRPFPAFAERFDKSPIKQLDQLEHFVRTRASYIAQTAMYGYLKTRMGTSFRRIFEDKEFAQVIHAATVRLFGSCLCDLALYSTARIFIGYAHDAQQQEAKAEQLALYIFDRCIVSGLPEGSQHLPEEGLRERFVLRLKHTDWLHASTSMHAFRWSEEDIVRHAPVIESYKQLDAEIVQNSIHFRWVDVHEQAKNRYALQDLYASWHEKLKHQMSHVSTEQT